MDIQQTKTLFETGQVAVSEPDPEAVFILTAKVFRFPMRTVKLVSQCGRFMRIEYHPYQRIDPDIVLCVLPGPAADHYHTAALNFQRRRESGIHPSKFYELMEPVADAVMMALDGLAPTPEEAAYVRRWLDFAIASGPVN